MTIYFNEIIRSSETKHVLWNSNEYRTLKVYLIVKQKYLENPTGKTKNQSVINEANCDSKYIGQNIKKPQNPFQRTFLTNEVCQ